MKSGILIFFILFITNYSFSQHDFCWSADTIIPSITTCNYQTGSSNNASQTKPSCATGGNADDDVWYQFVANSTTMSIKVNPSQSYDPVIELLTSCGSSAISLGCQDVGGNNIDETLTVSNLTIGNTYYFRVYHYGPGSGSSAFKVCVSGLAPPINNTPCNAYSLPSVNPSCNFLTFTTLGSSGSTLPPTPGCGGFLGGDVWFKVIVPPSGKLDISTKSIDFNDGVMALYSGSNCNSLSLVQCNDSRNSMQGNFMPYIYQSGLTPGQTMYIRVWEYNNNNNGRFGICVSSPDNYNCANALQICDLDGYGGTTSPQYSIDRPCNMRGKDEVPPGVFGTGYTGTSPVQIDNNSWLTFVASQTTAILTVDINHCENNLGMQMQIFGGVNCCNFVPVSNFLETNQTQTIVANGLTIGQTYYLVVDGFAGDICTYTITANSGVRVVEAIASQDTICAGDSVQITANVFGSGNYTYKWHSIPAGGPYPPTSSINVSPNQNIEYFVDIFGLCGDTVRSSAKIYVDALPPTPTVSTNSHTICPNDSVTITASASGVNIFNVYSNQFRTTLLGTTPYTFKPNGIQGSTSFYIASVSNLGCESASTRRVTVVSQDTMPPTIICFNNFDVTPDSNCNFTIPDYTNLITVSDSCSDSMSIIISQNPISGTILSGDGTSQQITITATDPYGNADSCNFTITLNSNNGPFIQCIGDTNVYLDNNCEYLIPDFTNIITVSNSCNSAPVISVVQSPVAGTVISGNQSPQLITVTATDSSGKSDSCTFTIFLLDNTSPQVLCPPNIDTTFSNRQCAFLVPDFSNQISIDDNCLPNSGVQAIQTPNAGTQYIINQDTTIIIQVKYTDSSGNSDSCEFNIDVKCIKDIIIHNFFSPNGDGKNEVFQIENIEYYSNSLKIFNRWGAIVFSADDYQNEWNGRASRGTNLIEGDNVPSGTYYYVLQLHSGSEKTYTGYLQIAY